MLKLSKKLIYCIYIDFKFFNTDIIYVCHYRPLDRIIGLDIVDM